MPAPADLPFLLPVLRMKKLIAFVLAAACTVSSWAQAPQPPEVAARHYILLDLTSSQVLAERDADVLGGVVRAGLEIAARLHRQVEAPVTGQQVEHVVEKADAGVGAAFAGTVEIQIELDLSLLGLPLYGGCA